MTKIELPCLMPNEHLLGVIARWFDTTGRNDFLMASKHVSTNLTKLTPSAIWRPIFGDLAHHYIDTTGLSKILSEHTLVPFYRPFLNAQDNLLLTEGSLLKNSEFKLLPALQGNMKSVGSWRWCAKCADEDYEMYGVTYWHTYHQIPTMLRCYKHNIALSSKCQSCGFEYTNFQKHWLPPIGNQCLHCQAPIEQTIIDNSPINNWLHATSIFLQQNKNEIDRQVFIRLMKDKLGVQSFPKNLPLALRKEAYEIQRNYEHWLQDEVIESYFTRERKAIFMPGQKILNIVKTVYRDSQVPPISILLILKSLGLEHELTRLLLEP